MKRITSVLVISAGVLLYGCAGSPSRQPPLAPGSLPVPTASVPVVPNVAGNWQFSAKSNTPGAQTFLIAGDINQADATVSGAMHIDDPNCFDPLITRSLAGTMSALTSSTWPPVPASLTATGSDGEVVTLTGNFTNLAVFYGTYVYATFNGTYSVDGGCAAGDEGTITGNYIDNIARQLDPTTLAGTFTSGSAQQVFHATGSIVQNSHPSDAGSFQLTGKVTFDTPCMSAGTITAGTYPSGSFILGKSVTLEFDTSNGILTFQGTFDPDTNVISGNYVVTGSSCNGSGTAVLSLSSAGLGYWDY